MLILLLTCPSGIILSMAQAQRNRSGDPTNFSANLDF